VGSPALSASDNSSGTRLRPPGYGDLVGAAFDLHRWKLYQALKWPAPASPADEHAAGAALTEYIWRGSDDETPKFGGEPEATPGLRERLRAWLRSTQP
jgi:hypothetical protein